MTYPPATFAADHVDNVGEVIEAADINNLETAVNDLVTEIDTKADLSAGKVPTAQQGDGVASVGTFLRGDRTWAAPAGGGDMLGANNLSELTAQPTARTNLGLGTAATHDHNDYDPAGSAAAMQPLDADLTQIAGLTSAADKVPYATGPQAWALATLTAFARSLLDDPDASTLLSTLGVSTFIKTLLDDADAGAALTTLGVSSFIQTLLDDSAASNARTTLGLGSMATQVKTAVDITGGTIVGITDLAVADGGTGASTASGARTALGLVIGTDVQAYDAELAALAGVTSAADKLPYFTGSGTAGVATTTQAGRDLLTRAVNNQTGTTYTLVAADVGAIVTMNNAAANTLTVPPNSSVAFPLGTRVEGMQLGAGATTIAPGAGVTLDSPFTVLTTPRQYAKFELIKIATDIWMVVIASQPGLELGYAEITANSASLTTTAADISGLSISVTVGNRPIGVRFFSPTSIIDSGTGRIFCTINEGATVLSRGESAQEASGAVTGHIDIFLRLGGANQPSVGSHTYKIQGASVGGATASHLIAAATYPCFIQCVEL